MRAKPVTFTDMPKRAYSVWCAVAVRECIAEYWEGNAAEWSRLARVSPSSIGYYSRPGKDGRFPSVEALDKMLGPLPEEWQVRLIAGYTTDLVPERFRSNFRIVGSKEKRESRLKLPLEAERVLDEIRRRCAKDQGVMRWLLATGKAMFNV
jgi:hypothetical protein